MENQGRSVALSAGWAVGTFVATMVVVLLLFMWLDVSATLIVPPLAIAVGASCYVYVLARRGD